MRRMRAVVVMMIIASLVGCGGSDEPDPRLAERADAARAAAGEAFPMIGEEVKALNYTSTGGGRWEICGMESSPTGAEYVAEVAITLTNVGSSEYPDSIESALKSAGWKVEDRTNEVLKASKDGLAFRASYGDGGINLSIRSGCVDASKDTIRKLTDKPRDDLGLSVSS